MTSAFVLSVVLCLMCGLVAVTVVDAAPAGDDFTIFDFTDGTYDMSDQWGYPYPMPENPYPRFPTYPRFQVPEIPRNNRFP